MSAVIWENGIPGAEQSKCKVCLAQVRERKTSRMLRRVSDEVNEVMGRRGGA